VLIFILILIVEYLVVPNWSARARPAPSGPGNPYWLIAGVSLEGLSLFCYGC